MTNPLPMDPFVCDGCHRRSRTTLLRAFLRQYLCGHCYLITSDALACGLHNAQVRGMGGVA
jgi:hypothetical protein